MYKWGVAIFTQSPFWIWEEGKQANVYFTILCGHHKANKYLCANNIATKTNLEYSYYILLSTW